LVLSYRRKGEMVALEVETPTGLVQEFAISSEAHDAIAFVTREATFEVRALPGNLTEEEQIAIAEALEETGLFARVQS
jgi:hypothetical protein